jgi:AraC-like DNA-binding protein
MERTSRTLGISVVKTGVLLPIVLRARELGIRTDPLLRRAHLPTNLGEDPAAIFPTTCWHNLYDRLSREYGVSDIGWQVGINSRLSAFSREFTRGIAFAPTLLEALRFTGRFGKRHCSSHQVSIRVRGDYCYIVHSNGGDIMPGAGQRSLARTASAMLVVREFLGDDWQPEVIVVNATRSELPTDGSFEGTRVICRVGYDIVRVPRSLLATSCHLPLITSGVQGDSVPDHIADQLERILAAWAIDECRSLAVIAEMLGTSPRTLQRRLTEAGTSYRKVMQNIRYNIAARMLRDSNARVIDVANSLGYEDPAHFTRFFHGIAGITPSLFRHLNHQGEFDSQMAT